MNEKDLLKTSETDWEHLENATEEEVDTSDIPPLGKEFFSRAELRMPEDKVTVTVNVDKEVLAWYRGQSADFQNLINTALRDYAESHR